jgi:hypothetical protein
VPGCGSADWWLSAGEVCRLLAAALDRPKPPGHAARWLWWRRHHQARFTWYQQRARLARNLRPDAGHDRDKPTMVDR